MAAENRKGMKDASFLKGTSGRKKLRSNERA